MSKRKRQRRKQSPRLKIPKFTKKGKVKMYQLFHVGQRVRFNFHEYDIVQSLANCDGAVVRIMDTMKHPLQADYRYFVKFPTGQKSWVPEYSLSEIGAATPQRPSQEQRKEKFSILVSKLTDCWGYSFTITTHQRRELHEGWVTTINHQAYNQGKPIVVSFCVTRERADEMHNEWKRVLTSGPLPDSVEEAGLGEWKFKNKVLHARASWYKAIPLS